MSKDKPLNAVKDKQQAEKNDKEMLPPATAVEKQKRLSSEEFLKGYDQMWKEGPLARYQDPDKWFRQLPSSTQNSKP